MPRGRGRIRAEDINAYNPPHVRNTAPEFFQVDWEQVAEIRAEPPDIDEGMYVEDSMSHYPQMGESRKITRLDIQTAIETVMEHWAWLVETGEIDETYWPLWASLGINAKNTLCEYSDRRWKKIPRGERFNYRHCDFCPYKKHYKKHCDSSGEPFSHWLRSNNDADRRLYAKEFLNKLIGLRKEIILNPDKFK